MNAIIGIRNGIFSFSYKWILKPIFFLMDPEDVHDRAVFWGRILGSNFLTRWMTGLMFRYSNDKYLSQNILGINFPNPVGLPAGFDKDANLMDILPEVGYGFQEIGSITGEACAGNPKPRLWRLKESKGLVVYYGLKNKGCEVLSEKLRGKKFRYPVGVSVAKTNCLETAETSKGVKDYVKAYKTMNEIGEFCVINISCPNVYGGQPFNTKERLGLLLSEIDKVEKKKPIFLKTSPDVTLQQMDDVIELIKKYRIDGIIISNLTKNRDNDKIKEKDIVSVGGVSGVPVREMANKLIEYTYKKSNGEFIIIGCGGIFSAEDAYKKIKLGSSLVQLITGMIFLGPQQISEINRGLVRLLKEDGYSNISEAVGKGVKK